MADNQFNPLADVMQGFQLGAAVDQAKFQSQNHQLELQKAQQELQAKQAQQQLATVAWQNNDRSMLGKLYGVNPTLGKDLELSMDNRDLEKAKGLQYIETLPIDERNDAYKVWRDTTRSNDAPDEYNKQFVNFQINNAKGLKRDYEKLETSTGIKLLEKNTGQIIDTPFGNKDTAVTPEAKFKNTTALRSDYLQNSKTFQAVREGYERVAASAKDPSAAGDLSLIFGYMKTLDPNSTVREGEFANAQNAGSAFQKVGALYNKVMNGERLTEKQRADFIDRSKKLYKQAEISQRKTVNQYTKIAERNSLNPKDVIIDFETTVPEVSENPEKSQLAIPKVGAVENGYQFLGGDPASPKSWRKK